MRPSSSRQIKQSQYDAVVIERSGVAGPSVFAIERGNGLVLSFRTKFWFYAGRGDDAWRFRESCRDVLRSGPIPSAREVRRSPSVQQSNGATSVG
jgi:hypothetical protein